MKHLTQYLLILLICSFNHFPLFAQSESTDKVKEIITNQSFLKLIDLLGDEVDLQLLETENAFDRVGTIKALEHFFADQIILMVEFKHEGNQSEDEFLIGQVTTSDTELELYIVLEEGKIVEISIEE